MDPFLGLCLKQGGEVGDNKLCVCTGLLHDYLLRKSNHLCREALSRLPDWGKSYVNRFYIITTLTYSYPKNRVAI